MPERRPRNRQPTPDMPDLGPILDRMRTAIADGDQPAARTHAAEYFRTHALTIAAMIGPAANRYRNAVANDTNPRTVPVRDASSLADTALALATQLVQAAALLEADEITPADAPEDGQA